MSDSKEEIKKANDRINILLTITDRDLPARNRTEANFWKSSFYKMDEEVRKANKGINRLHRKYYNLMMEYIAVKQELNEIQNILTIEPPSIESPHLINECVWINVKDELPPYELEVIVFEETTQNIYLAWRSHTSLDGEIWASEADLPDEKIIINYWMYTPDNPIEK